MEGAESPRKTEPVNGAQNKLPWFGKIPCRIGKFERHFAVTYGERKLLQHFIKVSE
jgi:hypothetical protein